ncbi:hypothetical protein EHS25_005451 [Saitozyma podzolica]|uniref:GST N-terminal domain-containing protein n=1 Tax=Saitozyma podzolica TaxID=1890683 RepID=A0A427XY74_9TREE|nr:hypothetical protein EHS25_005451 [Saitozyma podzolica]
MASPKITLHHLNASRSNRIFWALEELGLEYDVRVYSRLPSLRAPPQLAEVSPFGKAPALTIDSSTISESAYIIHRLLALPSPNRAAVEATPSDDSVYWAAFAEGSLMNLMQAELTVAATAKAWERGMEAVFRPQTKVNLEQVEQYLASRPGHYFSGSTTPGIADFMMFFPAW